MGGDDQTKNLIMAAVLSMMVVFGWFALFPPTPPPADTNTRTTAEGAPAAEGGTDVTAAAPVDRDKTLEDTRIQIETPAVTGSIRLKGGRIDDLHLTGYREELDASSDTIIFLTPEEAADPYFIDYGWQRVAGAKEMALPRSDTPWTIESGDKLTPDSPVTLVWDNGQGLIFRRKIAIDDKYLFTITQSVENTTGEEVKLVPFGRVSRLEGKATTALWILHEGAIAMVDGEQKDIDYDDLREIEPNPETGARYMYLKVEQDGWIGFTDKYWLSSMATKSGEPFNGYYQVRNSPQGPLYQALMRQPATTVGAGATTTVESFTFAGAKEFYTLRDYQATAGVNDLVNAIDWGWFYFLTKPIFQLLAWINGLIGNMGWSIIMLTLLIKAILFPLAWKSYVSMSKLKKLQPEMTKIKERVGDDRQAMQKEMMALYKKEKVNPAAGCLPILLQIPIFFSLYKVLFVTIEMRHAPFALWIDDLSAPDPTSFLNLFGLLPWGVPDPDSFFAIFSIGVFPILMGVTMWLQQKLNPAPTDPTQAMIFAWMPWVFMFMLGSFASGLVIYWVANNTITFIQQYLIMRSQGVDVDLFGNIKSSFKKKKKKPET